MNTLDSDRLFAHLRRGQTVGFGGEVHQSADSTMEMAREHARAGAPDGYVVLAENQSAGRGRDGRWECPAGKGLLLTVILRLGLRRTDRKLISLLGPVAAAETFEDFGVQARIKWPNDVVVADEGPELRVRKLGGVLVEQLSRGDAVPLHLLGIGLNLNQRSEELPGQTQWPATSLLVERPDGGAVERTRSCRRLLEKLDAYYRQLRLGNPEKLLARWRSLSCLLQRRIRARVDGQVITGRVTGLRATGGLIVRLPDGGQRHLVPERTTLLPAPSTSPG